MHIATFLYLLVIAMSALAALPSNAAEPRDTASAAYQRRDFELAYQLALPAALAGDAPSQYVLGVQLWRGHGVARNDAEAARWLASAAEQNQTDAMTDLAAMYRLGEGVEKDTRRAFSLSMQAAEMDNAAAQYDVGQAYQQGVGVSKDMIRARYWLERADAAESAQEAKRRPSGAKPESGVTGKPISTLPAGCRPARPPSAAMRKNNVTELTGALTMYIDSEARVRGVTTSNVSVDALKYDVVALFSVSLRSPECVLTDSKRSIYLQIPFKFVVY